MKQFMFLCAALAAIALLPTPSKADPPTSCADCQSHINVLVDALADLFLEEYILEERLIPLSDELTSLQQLDANLQNIINQILARDPFTPDDADQVVYWMGRQLQVHQQIDAVQSEINEIYARLATISAARRGLNAALKEYRDWYAEHCTPVPDPDPNPVPDPNFS